MSTSTLLLQQANNGQAQVTPSRFPSEIIIQYSPQGEAEAFYGVDGQAPGIKLAPGTTRVVINVNSLQLAYRTLNGEAKLQWEVV